MANPTVTIATNSTIIPIAETQPFDSTVRSISTFLLIIIILLTLLGNSLVIRAFISFRKLRNVTNYLVVSLAVTDILVAMFSMPVWAAYLLTGPPWIFSLWLKKIWQSMDILCSVASISHLLLISIERYICISSPLTYHSIVTTPKTRVAICAAWSFALTMTIIKLVTWDMSFSAAYQLTAFSLCFAAPVFIMSYAYIMIFRVSRTQAKKMLLKIGEKTKRFCLPKELKAAKTLGVVMGAFVLCWFPFFFLNFFNALCRTCPIQVGAVMVAKALHYFNSVLNPIIYGLMNKQFKTAFRHLFTSTYSSVTGKAQPVTRSDIERQLSSIKSWGLTSLKIRSSTQDKGNVATTELCNYLDKSTGTSL